MGSTILSSTIVWLTSSFQRFSVHCSTYPPTATPIAPSSAPSLRRLYCCCIVNVVGKRNATRACREAVFAQRIKCSPYTSAILQRTMRPQYPARPSYPHQATQSIPIPKPTLHPILSSVDRSGSSKDDKVCLDSWRFD
ncbi:hypothetical protein K503DRAFT_212691 [Rhizopogon vinicolor AM-OR11-026]|uniref:Uncharacterized protein n=1 Tax=Rhizopogon vinicolor AM-OR11-026 TaxID=1314800 RepID=A0A1B7MYV4_9AGAM|nr:hypothetical protein K503DRAFT_212691 [Rhizopogon vinicolor AM-OR11-026]